MATATKPYGIKGVTDNPRAPVLAKAKIGRMNEKGYPEKLDHIVFVQPQTGTEIEAFRELGTRPTSFLAAFPDDDTRTFVDAAWKRYGKSGLKCRGDGDRGVDRETGEERQCAGEYNKDNPVAHLCSFARPTNKNGKDYPPECKPSVSLRLVVPLAGALGLVQLDTGGVASSVPTLWWQIDQLAQTSGGALAGVAIKVAIRPFTTAHGLSFAWNLETPSEEELQILKDQFACLAPVRVIERGVVPVKALPPMSESIDQDIYGLPEELVRPEEFEPLPDELVNGDPAPVDNGYMQPENATPDIGVPGEVVAAELAYKAALKASSWPTAKQQSKIALMEANCAKAEAAGDWSHCVDWLTASTEQIPGGKG